MVDEMDLLSDLKEAEPLRPGAFDEARAVLRAAMAVERVPATKTAPRRRAWRGTRSRASLGIAALSAAAAAVALVVTSASAPSHNAPANPVLAQLATDITARQTTPPGNATLEIRNQSPISYKSGANGIDLYTDSGTYYWGYSKSDLQQAIAHHQDEGEGGFKRAVAAALYAAKGDIATARAAMAKANIGTGTNPGTTAGWAEIEKMNAIAKQQGIKYRPGKPLTPEEQTEQADNLIWMNSVDALTAAPENVQVRAGVLALMATMSNVSVKASHTSTAGQPTLTLVDSWPTLDPGLLESLVINASTGSPVAFFKANPGQPLNVTYYHTFRVTLAQIEAGKF